jgi:hypothetical protein
MPPAESVQLIEGFCIDLKKVLCRWVEEHNGMRWYYVAHVRDRKLVRSYSNCADPLDSNISPLDRASLEDTSTASPFTKMRFDG